MGDSGKDNGKVKVEDNVLPVNLYLILPRPICTTTFDETSQR